MLFMYCDNKKMPLLDLDDLKTVLRFAAAEGKAEIQKKSTTMEVQTKQ